MTLFSCNNEDSKAYQGKKIAKVNETYLYEEQLQKDFPLALSIEDSLQFRNQYIDNWVKEQVLLQTAENELPEIKKDVEYQLMKYRSSLLIYEYEKQYIKQQLDTNITQSEIEQFYNDNQDEFFLRDYIVKIVYAKYTNNTPDLDKVSKWYKYSTPSDAPNMRTHIDNYAIKFNYDTSAWIYFGDVLKDVPLQDYNKSSFIKNKKEITIDEGEFKYFLNILDYKLKDELSPLEFEKDRIISIILNMRTNEIRKNLSKQLYEDAIKNNQIELYPN